MCSRAKGISEHCTPEKYRKVFKMVDFDELKEGDVFILFESDGKVVESCDGHIFFKAREDARPVTGDENNSVLMADKELLFTTYRGLIGELDG